MGELFYPAPGVTQVQHERLMGRATTSGVFGFPTDLPLIYAPNSGTREIRVRASQRAIVEGYGWETDGAEVVITLDPNTSGSTRIDLVVLQLDRTTWTLSVQVKKGAPGSAAPLPTYNTSATGVWELPLAEVTVANNATTLAASTVVNKAWYIGSDGQIRCTPSTRPPHEAGRTVWEHPTGVQLISTGDRWLRVAEDTGLTTTSMSSGYSASRNGLFRRNGWVFLELTFSRNVTMSGNTGYKVGALPVGYRPPFLFQYIATCPSLQSVLPCSISADGTIIVNPYGVSISPGRAIVLQALMWPVA